MGIDATGAKPNVVTALLDKAFAKFDQNGDGSLDSSEFAKFNEILKPGIAVDGLGRPTVDYDQKMDQNSDGKVTKEEVESTPVIMPASLSGSDSFGSLISYLKMQDTPEALEAASLLGDQGTDAA